MKIRITPISCLIAAGVAVGVIASEDGPSLKLRGKNPPGAASREYLNAIQRTAQMVSDADAQALARRQGLDVLNLTWEDTGRYKNSSVGPNISDMTIQVAAQDPRGKGMTISAMPVIRFPNFSDKTCEIDPAEFTLLVGNEKGKGLKRISLYDFLSYTRPYLSNSRSWKGNNAGFAAPRDEKVLVSAQACFLPVPKQGIATFNPVVFNYQSERGNPAVLTILATREGTSTTIIDNTRDAFSNGSMWGQRLFHNQNGQRASLTGQRQSEFRPSNSGNSGSSNSVSGLNMVLLIQVPLKHRENRRQMYDMAPTATGGAKMESTKSVDRSGSDVENAVIGHGSFEGPFTEMDNLAVERDPRFPVRVTVQFYKATSNGIVSPDDMRQIKQQIDLVYAQSDVVGSLVTGGDTGRITEYEGPKVQPAGWWNDFWIRHSRNTGDSPEKARAKLSRLLGKNYMERPVTRLYLNDVLRKGK